MKTENNFSVVLGIGNRYQNDILIQDAGVFDIMGRCLPNSSKVTPSFLYVGEVWKKMVLSIQGKKEGSGSLFCSKEKTDKSARKKESTNVLCLTLNSYFKCPWRTVNGIYGLSKIVVGAFTGKGTRVVATVLWLQRLSRILQTEFRPTWRVLGLGRP